MIASPKPTMRTRLLDASIVSNHRNLFCSEYDDCLEIAVSGGWRSWSCVQCPLATRRTAPRVVLRVVPEIPETPSADPCEREDIPATLQ
jgi:hypothetical protein